MFLFGGTWCCVSCWGVLVESTNHMGGWVRNQFLLNVSEGRLGHTGKNFQRMLASSLGKPNYPKDSEHGSHLRALGSMADLVGPTSRDLATNNEASTVLSWDSVTLSLDLATLSSEKCDISFHILKTPVMNAFRQHLQWLRLCRNMSLPPFFTFLAVLCHYFQWSWLYHNTICTLMFSFPVPLSVALRHTFNGYHCAMPCLCTFSSSSHACGCLSPSLAMVLILPQHFFHFLPSPCRWFSSILKVMILPQQWPWLVPNLGNHPGNNA